MRSCKSLPGAGRGQRGDRLAARDRRSRRRRPGTHNVAGFHAGRGVPEHGDRGLSFGAEFFDPLGLVEEQDGQANDARSRSSSSAMNARPITAAPPGGEAEAGGQKHGQDRCGQRPGVQRKVSGPGDAHAGLPAVAAVRGRQSAASSNQRDDHGGEKRPPDLLDQNADAARPRSIDADEIQPIETARRRGRRRERSPGPRRRDG